MSTSIILPRSPSQSHPVSLLTRVPPGPWVFLRPSVPFSCLWGPPIADSGNPNYFSEPWARKPSGSQLPGLLVLLGFTKECGSCLTPLLSLPPIPLPLAPQGWCHQGWHSASQLWNTGQWLHRSWAIWAVFPSVGTLEVMPPSQTSLTILAAMHSVVSPLENSMDRGVGRLQSMGLQRIGQNWASGHVCTQIYILKPYPQCNGIWK